MGRRSGPPARESLVQARKELAAVLSDAGPERSLERLRRPDSEVLAMSLLTGEIPPVSSGARRLMDTLAELPLATANEIAGLSSFGSTTVYTHLGELRDAGLVSSASLGWFSPVSMRWFLTDLALSGMGRLGFHLA